MGALRQLSSYTPGLRPDNPRVSHRIFWTDRLPRDPEAETTNEADVQTNEEVAGVPRKRRLGRRELRRKEHGHWRLINAILKRL